MLRWLVTAWYRLLSAHVNVYWGAFPIPSKASSYLGKRFFAHRYFVENLAARLAMIAQAGGAIFASFAMLGLLASLAHRKHTSGVSCCNHPTVYVQVTVTIRLCTYVNYLNHLTVYMCKVTVTIRLWTCVNHCNHPIVNMCKVTVTIRLCTCVSYCDHPTVNMCKLL